MDLVTQNQAMYGNNINNKLVDNENKNIFLYFGTVNWLIIIITGLIICLRNSLLKYYFYYIFMIFMLTIACVICVPIMIFRPKNPSNFMLSYPFAIIMSRVFGLRWELRGEEILAKQQPSVLTVNHQSSLDVLAHCSIMNVVKTTMMVSRHDLSYLLPYRIFLTLCGSVFIDVNNPKTANETLVKTCSDISKYKTKLLTYPEGKCEANAEELNPFKKGAFVVAINGQFPIIPIVISPSYFFDSNKKYLTSGQTIIKVLDPISTVGLTMDDLDMLVEKTRTIMNDEYQKLRKEIQDGLKKKITILAFFQGAKEL